MMQFKLCHWGETGWWGHQCPFQNRIYKDKKPLYESLERFQDSKNLYPFEGRMRESLLLAKIIFGIFMDGFPSVQVEARKEVEGGIYSRPSNKSAKLLPAGLWLFKGAGWSKTSKHYIWAISESGWAIPSWLDEEMTAVGFPPGTNRNGIVWRGLVPLEARNPFDIITCCRGV